MLNRHFLSSPFAEGKIVAKENKCKFVEISVAIGHKVDELLVGILNQIRQKDQRKHADVGNRQIVINVSDDEESIGKFSDKPRFMSKTRLSASCSNFTLVGQRFLNKLLKSRNCSKSVEDLLSVIFWLLHVLICTLNFYFTRLLTRRSEMK